MITPHDCKKTLFSDLIIETVEEVQRTTKMHKINVQLDRSVEIWGDRYRTGQVLRSMSAPNYQILRLPFVLKTLG
jgi:hypothetical protein